MQTKIWRNHVRTNHVRLRARGITAAKKCKILVVGEFMKVKSEMSEIFTYYLVEETQELRLPRTQELRFLLFSADCGGV